MKFSNFCFSNKLRSSETNISDLEQGADKNFPLSKRYIFFTDKNSRYLDAFDSDNSNVDLLCEYKNLGFRSKLYSLKFSFLIKLEKPLKLKLNKY